MIGEVITIETAEKISNYDKLYQEKQKLVRYLRDQVLTNKKDMEKYRLSKDKNSMLIARSKLALSMELLNLMNLKR